jgi:PHP family Zn ribbon phosphoesterase
VFTKCPPAGGAAAANDCAVPKLCSCGEAAVVMKLGQKDVSGEDWRSGMSAVSNNGDEVRIRNICGSKKSTASRFHILVQMPGSQFLLQSFLL